MFQDLDTIVYQVALYSNLSCFIIDETGGGGGDGMKNVKQ